MKSDTWHYHPSQITGQIFTEMQRQQELWQVQVELKLNIYVSDSLHLSVLQKALLDS